jgi:tellurite resistance protein TerC
MLHYVYTNMFFFVFALVILSVLFIDLLFVGKNKHVISLKESLLWTSVWVSLAIGFYFFIKYYGDHIHNITDFDNLKSYVSLYSPALHLPNSDFNAALKIYRESAATDFLTGYLLEYTLSIDNVFVILMILTSFSVSPHNYKTVLFWGILGAIILRFIFIFVGSALIIKFSWILYIFGLFLVYTGIKMYIERNKIEKIEVRDHWLVRFLSRHINIHPEYLGAHFWKKIDKKFFFTPLFIVLIMIEFTDLVFAFDSIPAIFSITRDPYIVFFSNIFAIIGLRSLFFLLIKVVDYFHYLKVGISVLLAFVGVKLLLHHYLDDIGFKNIYSLYFILTTLTISVLASVAFPEKKVEVD